MFPLTLSGANCTQLFANVQEFVRRHQLSLGSNFIENPDQKPSQIQILLIQDLSASFPTRRHCLERNTQTARREEGKRGRERMRVLNTEGTEVSGLFK